MVEIIPRVYPGGLPVFWRDEQSGRMAAAVIAYFNDHADAEQFALVLDYCAYVIAAPCWSGCEVEQMEARLKATVKTPAELKEWVTDLFTETGIDLF